MDPDHHWQLGIDFKRSENIDGEAILAHAIPLGLSGNRRLQTCWTVLICGKYLRPDRWRLRSTPAQGANRRRGIGQSFEGRYSRLDYAERLPFPGCDEKELFALRHRGVVAAPSQSGRNCEKHDRKAHQSTWR